MTCPILLKTILYTMLKFYVLVLKKSSFYIRNKCEKTSKVRYNLYAYSDFEKNFTDSNKLHNVLET